MRCYIMKHTQFELCFQPIKPRIKCFNPSNALVDAAVGIEAMEWSVREGPTPTVKAESLVDHHSFISFLRRFASRRGGLLYKNRLTLVSLARPFIEYKDSKKIGNI